MSLSLGMWGYVGICEQARGTLQLKIGTQVMLLFNKDLQKGLGNGARGIVVGFVPTEQWVPKRHHGGEIS